MPTDAVRNALRLADLEREADECHLNVLFTKDGARNAAAILRSLAAVRSEATAAAEQNIGALKAGIEKLARERNALHADKERGHRYRDKLVARAEAAERERDILKRQLIECLDKRIAGMKPELDAAEQRIAALEAEISAWRNSVEGYSAAIRARDADVERLTRERDAERACTAVTILASSEARQDLIDRLAVAHGREDCTCNAAGYSPVWQEHDQHCAFRIMSEALPYVQLADHALADSETAPDYEAAARFLFDLLDDIDTAEDVAKADDATFRKLAHRLHRRRFEVAETDGYKLTFKPAGRAALAAEGDGTP